MCVGSAAVAKVPGPFRYCAAVGRSGAGVGEIDGFSNAYISCFRHGEVGNGRVEDFHFEICCLACFTVFLGINAVCSRHGHCCVGTCRVLLCRCPSVGSRPVEGGSGLAVGVKLQGLADADGRVARCGSHDAAVGCACAFVLEGVETVFIQKIGEQKHIVLTCLGSVDVAVLVISAVKTSVNHVVATQVAHVVDAGERPPANKVNIQIVTVGCCSYYVNVQIARLAYQQVIEGRVGC